MTEEEGTAVWVDAEVKARLDALRHGDQSYTSVIAGILDENDRLKRKGRQ